jgi:5-formaminoimidazole-4-carboxamide-1-(beta)-D-ribofuranosyl 5'-monophosphate synthetase
MMISRRQMADIIGSYEEDRITVGVLGSHSALDVCRGAKDCGFKTLVVCQRGREKTYSSHYKSRGGLGVVDETLVLDEFTDLTKPGILKKLREKNVVFVPHRSFEVYVGFDRIENEFAIPLFGSRSLLRAEERDAKKNQYYLLKKAKIPFPKRFKKPGEIDRLAIVKVAEAQRSYERAFFFASSPKDYASKSKQLLKEKKITEKGLDAAVIEEFVVGAQVNFNYFYSPLEKRLELLGTDMRRQTNLDGILRLPAPQQLEALKHIDLKSIEAGHVACTIKESLLEQVFELGERFVDACKREFPPGVIGPFALQGAFTPGPPKETAVVFDVSLRVQGSPGTRFTPYSGYLFREDLSVGERIGRELRRAVDEGRLAEVVT